MKITLLVLAFLVLAAPAAFAHDTWIMCLPPGVRSGADVTLHISSGAAFPKFDTAPEAAQIERCGWRVDGREGALSDFSHEKDNLAVTGRVTTDGAAVVFAEFKPKAIDRTPDEVKAYMDEIGAPESVRRAYQSDGPNAKFHETLTTHAKTYLRVGESGDATGCLGPVGFNIDFLPDRDPTSLKVGDTLTIRVFRGGKEMESFPVGAVSGAGKTTMQRTSKAGLVAIAIDAPGWWLIRGTELRRQTDGTWESDFTTLTFFVANN